MEEERRKDKEKEVWCNFMMDEVVRTRE